MDFRLTCIASMKKFLRHRLLPFGVALIIPEWIFAWAIQQWIVARRIAKEGGEGWTITHGFFVNMGGFHAFVREDTGKGPLIHDSDEPYYPLDEIEVIKMFRNGELDLPLESEIQG
ncbi:hypothetical protein CPB86DRAFT_253713 [Serendipita vermifera]|nr:hypothetical protein CPB86DRAFT_253713 [Serendipita vermifera]